MALGTVEDIISAARVLLQDTIETYRYSDADLLLALNIGMLEARRLRPDLFLATITTSTPQYAAIDTTAIALDETYLTALLYFIVGWAQLRDDEDVTDARSAAFMQSFTTRLITGAA